MSVGFLPMLRFTAAATAGAALAALVMGIPTDVVPNPWFTRMTPVRALDYFLLGLTSLLSGTLLATYILPRATRDRAGAAGLGGGFLTTLAVGCPVCNKLIVALLGFSGAFTYFAPIQPLIGVVAVAMVATGLGLRLRALRAPCQAQSPLASGPTSEPGDLE